MKIQIKKLHPEAAIPTYGTSMAAAIDLCAMVDEVIFLHPYTSATLIPTGIAVNIGSCEVAAMILPRSGRGHKEGLVLGNSVGLIDGDYQGELFISAWNRSRAAIRIDPGDRIAQLVFVPVVRAEFELVADFIATERGAGGFGSTGR